MTAHGFVRSLRRLMQSPPDAEAGTCDLCAGALPASHAHVANVQARRLLCVCATCVAPHPVRDATLTSASSGPLRAIPGRYAVLPRLTRAEWQPLGIPVDLAFLLRDRERGAVLAIYPGPAGAVESPIPTSAWRGLVAAHEWIACAEPDIEAVLVRRDALGYRCHLVPIDACYRLVGLIRAHWTGSGGGPRVHSAIDEFFASVLEACGGSEPGPETVGAGNLGAQP